MAEALKVSRGSFYWHFADIGAFHAAILNRWREVATEQVIAGVEAARNGDMGKDPLAVLLRLTFGSKHTLEKAVRSWAANDARARAAVVAAQGRFDVVDVDLIVDVEQAAEDVRTGSEIAFIPSYGSLLAATTSPYVQKVVRRG